MALDPQTTEIIDTETILETLRAATRGTEYDGRLFLVGGFVRDKVMGLPSAKDDIDIVLEGDALALAHFLRERGAADHEPVVYPALRHGDGRRQRPRCGAGDGPH